jgi:hypothetical protein
MLNHKLGLMRPVSSVAAFNSVESGTRRTSFWIITCNPETNSAALLISAANLRLRRLLSSRSITAGNRIRPFPRLNRSMSAEPSTVCNR